MVARSSRSAACLVGCVLAFAWLFACGKTATKPATLAGCTEDSTLSCAPGATGYSCDSTHTPWETNAGLSCSTGFADTSTGGEGYCCDDACSGGGNLEYCAADDNLGCPTNAYGFQCAMGAPAPDEDDPSLTCMGPTPDADGCSDDYCCEPTSTGGSSGGSSGGAETCTVDSSLDCGSGLQGVACSVANGPPDSTFGFCSNQSPPSSGTVGYCCVSGKFAGCTQDGTTWASCSFPSVGFSCAPGYPDPGTDDLALTCSGPVTDPTNGDYDYCCQ